MYKSSLIIDFQYFASIIYYKLIIKDLYIIFDVCIEHKKKSFANRAIISGANGRIVLSVPLIKGRNQKTILKDVRIANAGNWQLMHWRSIVSSYNNSPWFKYFSDDLAGIFSKRFEFLLDWNLTCFEWTLKIMKMDINYEVTSEQVKILSGMEDYRNKIIPGADQSVSAIRYPQVFENKLGFLPDLSILDLLCCEGPKNAVLLLKSQG